MGDPERRARTILLAASLVAVALPFLGVRFPPITDLPQQTAQIRLLVDAWAHPSAAYRIDWWGPNHLAYAVLGAAWWVAGPENAGRVAMLAVGVLWVVCAHHLAARRGRSAAAAALASALFFNHATYWGFYSFALGAPLLALWIDATDRLPARPSWPQRLGILAGALALYGAHALVFAAGMAWLGLSALARGGLRGAASRLLPAAPAVALAAAWAARLRGTPFDASRIPPVWETGLADRLRPEWLAQAALGGLRGPAEAAAAVALAAWIAAGLASAWLGRRSAAEARAPARPDVALLWAAAFLAAAALLLPSKTASTIRFAERWLPLAAFLAVLGVPAPPRPRRAILAAACAGVLAFGAATASAWRAFEARELSGLEASVAAIAPGERVLGLDAVKTSDVVRGRPFLQTFAWAQVLHGNPLAFSFSIFPSSLVRARPAPPDPWTPNLIWYAERARPDDLRWFDVVLLNAEDDAAHARAAEALALRPLTRAGRWRLYRTSRGEPPPWSPTFLARHSLCAP